MSSLLCFVTGGIVCEWTLQDSLLLTVEENAPNEVWTLLQYRLMVNFICLMVRDENKKPLTLYQLSKDVCSEVCSLRRKEIVTKLQSLNTEYIVNRDDNGKVFVEAISNCAPIVTSKYGWQKKTAKQENTPVESVMEINATEESSEKQLEDAESSENHLGDADTGVYSTPAMAEADGSVDSNDETLPCEMLDGIETEKDNVGVNNVYKLIESQLNDILHILKESNEARWANTSTQELESMLTDTSKLKGFLVKELTNISCYLNLEFLGTDKEL